MKKLKTIFFGTPDFSIPALETLFSHPNVEITKVISMPDRPSGRGKLLHSPPIIDYCKNNKIPFLQTENINQETDFIEQIKKDKVDLFIVLAFAQFLKNELLDIPLFGAFNIHTSLLPKYRGAAPIQYALLNHDKKTGVSIQKMVKKMDAGDIAYSLETPIFENEHGHSLYTRLKYLSAVSLFHFLDLLLNNSLHYEKQIEQNVSYAPSIKKDDGHIFFNSMNYFEITGKLKAFHPWPGIFVLMNGKRLKIFELEISAQKLSPGEIDISSGQLLVGCLDETFRIGTVQLEGKKKSSDTELLNGLQNYLKNGEQITFS